MHTLHHIAIQASSPEKAFDVVGKALEEGMADWSDWSVVGGGRWHSKGDQYQYEADPSDVLCYRDDTDKFIEIVNSSILRRQQALLEVMQFMKQSPEDLLLEQRQRFMRNDVWPSPLIEQDTLDMPLYYLQRMMGLLTNEYGSDSGLYDLVERTADIKYLRRRILDESIRNNEYLVPVDFHF